MRLLNLELKNIGPFVSAELDFIGDGNVEKPPVTIITGENGTGKTIILDAIRGILLGKHKKANERNIFRSQDFKVSLDVHLLKERKNLLSEDKYANGNLTVKSKIISKYLDLAIYPRWIWNYWTSKTSEEAIGTDNLVNPKVEDFLIGALDGIQKNSEIVELITFFDYYGTSNNPQEQELGTLVLNIIKKIMSKNIPNGELRYVSRKTMMPIISQLGHEIELNKLSSGSLYTVQRMIGILGQMYAVNQLHKLPIEDICKTPGVLLIDEAENHLHPKWQKTFLNDILDVFPNLQIIVTTHSPFIVSSVENARVYVCESRIDHAEVVDSTSDYSNRPIEEVLVSPVFDTTPFSSKITDLLERRKAAIINGNKEEENKIEAELKRLNPNHFAYLDIEQMLESISK